MLSESVLWLKYQFSHHNIFMYSFYQPKIPIMCIIKAMMTEDTSINHTCWNEIALRNNGFTDVANDA